MNRFRRSPILAIALALWLGVGAVVSSALAADMSSRMAMAAGMDDANHANPDVCPACSAPDGSAVAVDCLPYCHLAGSMVLPPALALEEAYPTAFAVEPVLPPDGFVDSFDPSPPRSFLQS